MGYQKDLCLQPWVNKKWTSKWYYYRPPTKLWEGNVFTGVCWSFCPKRVRGTHPPWGRYVWGWVLVPSPPPETWDRDMVDKRVVCILLECCLVSYHVLLENRGFHTRKFVMNVSHLCRYNHKMLLFSAIFLASAYYFTTSIGSVGFILANSFNMLARICHR